MNIIRDYIENFYARSILENQPPEPLLNKEGEVIDSKKLADHDVVYTLDGRAIDMKHLIREMESAKIAIIGKEPLLGPYIHNFVPIYTWLVPTMATDGTRLFVNPSFADELDWHAKIFVILHEIMHCILLHTKRGKDFDPEVSNIAADYEVNALLVDTVSFFTEVFVKKWKGFINMEWLGDNFEKIYKRIEKDYPKGQTNNDKHKGGPCQCGAPGDQGQPGEGSGQGSGEGRGQGACSCGGSGGGGDFMTPEGIDPGQNGAIISEELGRRIAKASGYDDKEAGDDSANEEKWTQAANEIVKKAGKGNGAGTSGRGGGLVQALERLHKGDVNWMSILKRYIGKALAPDPYYKVGAKKHLSSPLIRRGFHNAYDALDNIVVLVDTSGSMYSNPKTIPRILNEVNQLLFAKKVKEIKLVFFDSDIGEVEKIKGGSKGTPKIKSAPVGGGTMFKPCFDWLNKLGNISLVIFITDGQNADGTPRRPTYANKFIWLIYDNAGYKAPFGKQITINPE
jgi:predicted metal-dependent peptidase